MKKNTNVTIQTADIISKIYFAMILAFLPLYFDANFYTAMIVAKGRFYWGIAAVMGIGICIALVLSVVKKQEVLRYRSRLNLLDWSMIGYAIAISLSFLLSENKKDAYFGTGGFYVGTLTLISLIIYYFFVSRSLTGGKRLWDMIVILNVFVFLWIVCNTLSIDIFGMHAKISKSQHFAYFACLGQMDSVSAYLCLLIPIVIVFFLNEKKVQFWYCAFLLTGLMAFTGIRTDGVYIGVTVCAVFLIPYAISNIQRLKNLLRIGIIWGIAITVYSVCTVVMPERLGTDMGISGTLIKYWGGAVMIVICGVLLFWLEKTRMLVSDKMLKRFSRVTTVGLILVLVVFLAHGIVNLAQGDLGWGNGRGGIWLGALDLFVAYNPLQKLFGLGLTAIATDLTYYVTALNGWKNIMVANAHNDFLEYLLSTGLVGFAAYTATWVIPIIQFVRQKQHEWSVAKIAYFMSLMAYLGQSIVGNPYSLSVPIMFLVFTLYRNEDFAGKITDR